MQWCAGSTSDDATPDGDAGSPTHERHVTLVLRLVLDERGQVLHGQAIDVADGSSDHFRGWRGLVQTVARLLARYGLEKPQQ
jgi:hypothetical protein